MTEILKASAGSGKTYNLAKKYISLLLGADSADAYRHILAVTFTNKATAEMKSRILRELSVLANTPDRSAYLSDLLRETGKDKETLRRLSAMYLQSILHDYSAFAVSTIDKFFQQALKAFTREIGFFASYQVELDRESLVGEAVERILDSLPERGSELVRWVGEHMEEQLGAGVRFRLDSGLGQTANQVLSEGFIQACEAAGISPADAFSQDRLREIRAACTALIRDFHARIHSAALDLDKTLSDKKRPYLAPYLKPFSLVRPVKFPSQKTLLSEASGSAFAALLTGPAFRVYNTARTIRELTYALGFARDFRSELDALLHEKNVLSLDDSNALLRRIIDGSDAPFIYEKLGVRYRHFLLDEFQDTSRVQWENMLPLLRETAAAGGTNFVVGDVKQSIYRWRDSDWRLLDREVADSLPDCAPPIPLCSNYRSARTVVEFNNSFFTSAAKRLGIDSVFSDVKQEVCAKDAQPGCVEVVFCAPEGRKQKNVEAENAAVLAAVGRAMAAGARESDIAVLVRTHEVGNRIADALVADGYAVVSDDSLNVKNAESVSLIIARMCLMLNENDQLARYILQDVELEDPGICESLVGLAEHYVRALLALRPEYARDETQYLYSFIDILQEWTATNGNDLAGFLQYWDSKPSFEISSPEDVRAIRIMTVHKAKGLEFPFVIVTDAEDYSVKPEKWGWCVPEPEGTALPPLLSSTVYPAPFTKDTENTCFSGAYRQERELAVIDMANLFYVALTRACKSLTIVSMLPAQKKMDQLKKEMEEGMDGLCECSSAPELLYRFIGGGTGRTYGTPYDFSLLEHPARTEERMPSIYRSIPLGGRLTPSTDAADFFGADGAVGVDASPRLAGIQLHEILSGVDRLSDLDGAGDGPEIALLRARVAAHPAWFDDCPPGSAYNETEIIDTDGSVYRPDRVVVRDGAVTVIDYKFGEPRPAYTAQARRYARLYREMDHESVNAYLWYVYEDKIVEV